MTIPKWQVFMASITQRRTKSGKLRYQVYIRMRGKAPMIKTFATLSQARQWAAKEETALRFSRDFRLPEGERVTLREAAERFIDSYLSRYSPSCSQDIERHLRFWIRQLGGLYLSRMQASDILAVRDAIASERTPATANRYVTSLSALMAVAVKEWNIIEGNPCHNIRRITESKGRLRYLEQAELTRLLAEVRASRARQLYPQVILSIATGVRRSEMLALTWRDADLKNAVVTVQKTIYRDTTKNRLSRAIPLVADAVAALREWRASSAINIAGRIFPEAFPRKAWEQAVERAALRDFRWHDLRHTCASYLAMQGVPVRTIAEILGHQTLAMVMRYAQLSPEHLRDSMNGIADFLEKSAALVQHEK